jgi:hypothetical protein
MGGVERVAVRQFALLAIIGELAQVALVGLHCMGRKPSDIALIVKELPDFLLKHTVGLCSKVSA